MCRKRSVKNASKCTILVHVPPDDTLDWLLSSYWTALLGCLSRGDLAFSGDAIDLPSLLVQFLERILHMPINRRCSCQNLIFVLIILWSPKSWCRWRSVTAGISCDLLYDILLGYGANDGFVTSFCRHFVCDSNFAHLHPFRIIIFHV